MHKYLRFAQMNPTGELVVRLDQLIGVQQGVDTHGSAANFCHLLLEYRPEPITVIGNFDDIMTDLEIANGHGTIVDAVHESEGVE